MSLRDELLAIADCKVEELNVPEWYRAIHVRGLTLEERTKIADEANGMNGATDATKNSVLTRRLVQYGVCNPDGDRVFEESDFEALGRKNANVLDRIGLKVSELSKLGAESAKELEKNSDPTQTADSASS